MNCCGIGAAAKNESMMCSVRAVFWSLGSVSHKCTDQQQHDHIAQEFVIPHLSARCDMVPSPWMHWTVESQSTCWGHMARPSSGRCAFDSFAFCIVIHCQTLLLIPCTSSLDICARCVQHVFVVMVRWPVWTCTRAKYDLTYMWCGFTTIKMYRFAFGLGWLLSVLLIPLSRFARI